MQKWGLQKHVWVRLGSQDMWKELCNTLSSAHQSPPCCWLLTWPSWLVPSRKPLWWGRISLSFSLYNAKFPQLLQPSLSCPSLWKWTGLPATRCYGSWSARGSEKKRFIAYPKGHENFLLCPTITCFCNWPVKTHMHIFILLQSSSFLSSPLLCSPLALPFSLHLSLCVRFSSHQPDPPVCPMSPLSAWGLGNLLSLLLQQFSNPSH